MVSVSERVMLGRKAEGTATPGFKPIHQINSFRMLFMNPSVATTDVRRIAAGIRVVPQLAENRPFGLIVLVDIASHL
jgi:hypothetical protein